MQPYLLAVLVQHPLQPNRFFRRCQGLDRLLGTEVAGAFAADHQVAVSLWPP
jgi:hypothetical protein